jgi:hypothetical protein
MIIWKSDTLENRTEWAESRGLERNGPSENNGEILPVVSPELKLQNNYGYWTQLPTRLPGEHTTLGKLAEGEELGSNLLQVLHRRPRSWAGWARSQGRTQPSPRGCEKAILARGGSWAAKIRAGCRATTSKLWLLPPSADCPTTTPARRW